MIDHIDIKELGLEDDPKVYLAITIHLKLNGYAPKYSLDYLKNMNIGEKQKASHYKNDLPNGGGEGFSPIENTKRTSPKQAIFSHLIFYISRENLKRAYR